MELNIEPDPEPRNSRWHKRIVKTVSVANTKTGKYCELECGHMVMMFGNTDMAGGKALCQQCRDYDQAGG